MLEEFERTSFLLKMTSLSKIYCVKKVSYYYFCVILSYNDMKDIGQKNSYGRLALWDLKRKYI